MGAPRLRRRACLQLLGVGTAAALGGLGGCRSRVPDRRDGPPRLGLLQFVRAPAPDAARAGFLEELARQGFTPGREVVVWKRSAGGSMAGCRERTLELLERGADMLVAIGTPPLTAILSLAPGHLPVVFCYCSNPWGAGAGSSYTTHRRNAVGSVSTNPLGAQLDLARRLVPSLTNVGLVYDPSEPNANFEAELMAQAATDRDLLLEVEPVAGPSEVAAAALALARRQVEALVRVGDYATAVAFAPLAAIGLRHDLPVFSVDPVDITVRGCLGVVGWDEGQDGALAARLAARVLRGTPPADLPFEPVTRQRLLLNRATARSLGLALPAPLLEQADRVVG